MFRPMAITVCGALLGSLLLALTAIPVFASYAFRHGISEKQKERDTHGWMARLNQAYERGFLPMGWQDESKR